MINRPRYFEVKSAKYGIVIGIWYHFLHMEKNTKVSVVIATRNEEEVIGNLIRSIRKQSYSNIEILLVDNKSEDKTVKIAHKYKVRTFSFGPERSTQRNLGARKAKGKYLLFLDADMQLSSSVIEECVRVAKKSKNIGAVVIPEMSVAHTFWEKVKAFERSFYNESGDTLTDAARFFIRKVFWQVGGYDETITGPEDWDLPETVEKAGYKIVRITSVIYHHERAPSLLLLVRKKYYYALKAHRYLQKQNIGLIGPKTIYFLRPVFYKRWRKLVSQPILSLAMFVMFGVELIGGGVGYFVGRFKNE